MYLKNIVKMMLIIGVFTMSGCAQLRPYTPPVIQGKKINTNHIYQLKPGLTKKQVSFLLGTPDIEAPFKSDKWVYIYTFQKTPNSIREQKSLILIFKSGVLHSISGNYPPPQTIYNS